MTDRLPAGAAIPKDTRAVRPSIRGQVKGVCVTFPACDGSGYFTARQFRDGRIPSCYCGAGQLIPANPAACLELCPERMHEHPDAADMARLAHRGGPEGETYAAGDSRGFCVSCGFRMPAGADPDYFYCRKCSHITERAIDGTFGCFRAAPFSPEVEEANGRARRRHPSGVTIPRKDDAPERIRAGMVECVPAPGGDDAIPF